MGVIQVNGIRLHAKHGCMPEEAVIGGDYIIDVTITTDLSEAESSDELSDTVDYCAVYEIVKKEMEIRSKLVEHVAKRILRSLRHEYHCVSKFDVKVTKIKPPVGGAVDSVSVIVSG